jgi:hypothetical protein
MGLVSRRYRESRFFKAARTLSEAIHELAGYQEIPEFRYASASIGSTRLEGDVAFDDLDGSLTALQSEFHISHTKTSAGSDTVIMLRRQGEKTGGNHSRSEGGRLNMKYRTATCAA